MPQGKERILLVDDEPFIIRMQKQSLERLGYIVTARASSVDALEAFQASPSKFDLLITDMTMPAMTGDKLARAVKKIRPDMPVIICTGFSEKLNPDELTSDIDGFLMKPVDRKQMARKVRMVLDQSVKLTD